MSSTDTKKLKNKAPKKPYKESKWLKTHENWAPSKVNFKYKEGSG